MDLDSLKAGLNERLAGSAPLPGFGFADMQRIPRSRGLLLKLHRNLLMETVLYVLSVVAFLWAAVDAEEPSISIYFYTCSALALLFVPIYLRLSRRIHHQLQADSNVHGGLTELLNILKAYHRRYIYFNMAMVPICFSYIIGLTIMFPSHPRSTFSLNQEESWFQGERLILLIVISIIAGALLLMTYLISKLWLHWLYGRYICELERDLEDMKP